jgi:drug/metabolite transporter (DMT)-like permease
LSHGARSPAQAIEPGLLPRPPAAPGLIIAVAIFGVSWAAVLVRWSAASAYALAFWRLALSLVIIGVAISFGRDWRRATDVRSSEIALLAVAGALLALHFVAFFRSLELTTVASSTLFVNLHPLFAAVLSVVWLNERPARREWVGIAIAIAGAMVIGGASLKLGPDAWRGNVLALLGAALIAGYNWALRYVRAYIVNLAVLGEPIGASLLAWWLLGGGEVPGPSTVGGGLLIIAGLAISIYARRGVGT